MIFIDINVFVDVLSGRIGFRSSAKLIDLVRTGKIFGSISSLTVPILWYIIKKFMKDSIQAQNTVKNVITGFNIVNLNNNILKNSFKIGNEDFEDTIQYCSAIKDNCKIIITRNKKHFINFKNVNVYTPEEFLTKEGIKW